MLAVDRAVLAADRAVGGQHQLHLPGVAAPRPQQRVGGQARRWGRRPGASPTAGRGTAATPCPTAPPEGCRRKRCTSRRTAMARSTARWLAGSRVRPNKRQAGGQVDQGRARRPAPRPTATESLRRAVHTDALAESAPQLGLPGCSPVPPGLSVGGVAPDPPPGSVLPGLVACPPRPGPSPADARRSGRRGQPDDAPWRSAAPSRPPRSRTLQAVWPGASWPGRGDGWALPGGGPEVGGQRSEKRLVEVGIHQLEQRPHRPLRRPRIVSGSIPLASCAGLG